MEFGPWELCGCLCCLLRSVLRSNSFRKCSASSHSCPTSQAFIAQAYEISSACPAKTIDIKCLASKLRFGQNYISMTYQHDFVYMSSTTKWNHPSNVESRQFFRWYLSIPTFGPHLLLQVPQRLRGLLPIGHQHWKLQSLSYTQPASTSHDLWLTKRGWKKNKSCLSYTQVDGWAAQGKTYMNQIQSFQSIPPKDWGYKIDKMAQWNHHTSYKKTKKILRENRSSKLNPFTQHQTSHHNFGQSNHISIAFNCQA